MNLSIKCSFCSVFMIYGRSDFDTRIMEISLQIDNVFYLYIYVGNLLSLFLVKNVPSQKVGYVCSVANFYRLKVLIADQNLISYSDSSFRMTFKSSFGYKNFTFFGTVGNTVCIQWRYFPRTSHMRSGFIRIL